MSDNDGREIDLIIGVTFGRHVMGMEVTQRVIEGPELSAAEKVEVLRRALRAAQWQLRGEDLR